MRRSALLIIRDEHASLSAMLRSLLAMLDRGPEPDGIDQHERFFDVLRAMLFYIGEFPEKQHHPKESDLLFPRVARAAPDTLAAIERLEHDHMGGEERVRELVHLLMAWEYLGESRREPFETAARAYVHFYLEHMQLEESTVLPAAEAHLSEADWQALDLAFSTHRDPLTRHSPRDPAFNRLFTRIVMQAPAPVGVGQV